MATLSADSPRSFDLSGYARIPVIASDIIYQGAALGFSSTSGNVRPLVAGDVFAGFAVERCDNSAGAAAARLVNALQKGAAILTVSGATVDDKGKSVYASDDNTFTLTASTNSYIGRVEGYVSSTQLLVAFDAERAQFGHIAALTTGSGGTADGVSEAVSIGAALSGTTGGTANGAVETHTVIVDITGPIGTADGAMEAIGDTSTGDRSGPIGNNFRELTTKLTSQIALNLIISNNVAELQAARVTDAATLLSLKNNVTELEDKLNALLQMLKGQ